MALACRPRTAATDAPRVRSGQLASASGKPFRRIINIGIGGSDLGPRMAVEAAVEQLAPHLVCAGIQPSTTLIAPELTPYRLGQLMALYEHKVFVQGWISSTTAMIRRWRAQRASALPRSRIQSEEGVTVVTQLRYGLVNI